MCETGDALIQKKETQVRQFIQKHANGDYFEDSEKERIILANCALAMLDLIDYWLWLKLIKE